MGLGDTDCGCAGDYGGFVLYLSVRPPFASSEVSLTAFGYDGGTVWSRCLRLVGGGSWTLVPNMKQECVDAYHERV
jgi:hypothetical protein